MSSESICGAAKSLGMPEATLHTWVQQAKKRGECTVKSAEGEPSTVNVGELMGENKALHQRLRG